MSSFFSEKSKSKRKLYVGSQALGYRRDFMEVIPASIWGHAFRERLLIDLKENPILLVEPSSNSQQQKGDNGKAYI